MGPIAYSLCQKPIVGAVLWIASLCSFPPLFSNEPIALTETDATVSKTFDVPVDKKYQISITFEFESAEARLTDKIVGSRFDKSCGIDVIYEEIPEQTRADLGRPIPFRVVVRRAADRSVVLERTYVSLCVTSHDERTKTRTIGWVELQRGEYTAEVTNLHAQSGLERVKTQISLYSGQGK